MAAVAPTHIRSTPSGSPQSAPKTAAVTPQTIRMEASPVRAMASSLPHTMALGRIGAAASRASVPVDRSIKRERMPEAAPDEEEHHGDGGREVVEHRLAAVAQRARRHGDGRRLGGRPALQAAGVEPARQPRRQRLRVLLPDERVGPVDDLEARRGRGAGSHHRDEEVARGSCGPERRRRPPASDAVGHLALQRPPASATSRTTTLPRELARVHGGAHQGRRRTGHADRQRGRWMRCRRRRTRGWRRWRAAPPGR